MKYELSVFRPYALPINYLSSWKQKVRYHANLATKKIHGLGSKINNSSIFYVENKAEQKYADTIKIERWSNIPLVYRKTLKHKDSNVEVSTWIRETLAFTIQATIKGEYSIPQNTQKTDHTTMFLPLIKKLKAVQEQEEYTLISTIQNRFYAKQHDKSKEFTTLFQKGKHITLIYLEPQTEYEKKHVTTWIKTGLYKLGGSKKHFTETHEQDLRYHSRSLHVFLNGDTTIKKKGKKILKTIIPHALHLAYGTEEILNATTTQLPFKRDMIYEWVPLIHFLNPLVLEGKTNLPSLFNRSIARSWFIRADLLLKIREKYLGFFDSILNYKNIHTHLPIIITQLRSIPIGYLNTVQAPLIPEITPSQAMHPLKKEILNVLRKHEQQILQDDNNIDLKYQRGLTVSMITTKLNKKNGKETRKIKKHLNELQKLGYISWAPYIGPGRRKHSKIYFIAEDHITLKEYYKQALDAKLAKPIQALLEQQV